MHSRAELVELQVEQQQVQNSSLGTGGVPPFGPLVAGAAVVAGVTEPGVAGEYVLKNSIHSAVTEDGSLW